MQSFPFYKQLDKADCGPACLKMISMYYGKKYDIEYLRERSFITQRGVSLLGLSDAAESIGFHTQGASISWEQLRDEVPLPAIVHWKKTHFVVVYRIIASTGLRSFFKKRTKSIVFVADPSHGLLKYNAAEFVGHWCNNDNGRLQGTALLLETTPNFYSRGKQDSKEKNIALRSLFQLLVPYKNYLFQLLLGLIVGTLISLALPLLTQSIVDYGISNQDMSFVMIVLIAQMVLMFGQTANGLIQNWISLHITSRVSIKFVSAFLAKIMRLPISFFYTRTIGDIMQRMHDQSRIQSFITGILISALYALITLIAYSFVMLHYDAGILFVFYLGSSLNLAWISAFLKMRSELDYKRFQQAANNQNNLVQLIGGMQEIRIAGCEKQKRWEWERIQTKLFKLSLKGLMLNQNQVLGSTFIDQSKNIFISFLSAKAVIDGNITLGMMVAIQYIMGQLNAPIQRFIGFIQSGQDAKISLDRLNTVYNKDDEELPERKRLFEIPRLASINVRNLTFQYEGPGSQKVLKNLTFEIPCKKITAVVGKSGSGKTTLLKILLRIHVPIGGEIFLDRVPFTEYSPSVWRNNCGVVMQDGFIFTDTVKNNICLEEEDHDNSRLEEAVSVANIGDFIKSLPLGYDTKIGSEGHGLSSGQKQRILIARALYKKADFIFFDEATNSLDSQNEKSIIDNLDLIFRTKTAVIIAHRLSTIRKADQILVLDNGIIAEKGTHDELIQAKGIYYELVKNQL